MFSADSGAARRRISLSIASTSDIRHRRRYEVVGPAGRLASGSLRPSELGRTTVSLCVPAHGFSDLKINVAGRTKLPDNRLVGLRVVRILDARAPGRRAP